MLPVSSWPAGPQGASLSPFGRPCQVNLSCCPGGFYPLPKGAWVVQTTSNQVIMVVRPLANNWLWQNPPRVPGTGILPGQCPPPVPGIPIPAPPITGCPPPNIPGAPTWSPGNWPTHDQCLEAWRAWQRAIGRTDPVIRPTPGRKPPNWFGWKPATSPPDQIMVLIPGSSAGTVLSDGENVQITGGGCALITQAFSV